MRVFLNDGFEIFVLLWKARDHATNLAHQLFNVGQLVPAVFFEDGVLNTKLKKLIKVKVTQSPVLVTRSAKSIQAAANFDSLIIQKFM